jgi:hypothetical protein
MIARQFPQQVALLVVLQADVALQLASTTIVSAPKLPLWKTLDCLFGSFLEAWALLCMGVCMYVCMCVQVWMYTYMHGMHLYAHTYVHTFMVEIHLH